MNGNDCSLALTFKAQDTTTRHEAVTRTPRSEPLARQEGAPGRVTPSAPPRRSASFSRASSKAPSEGATASHFEHELQPSPARSTWIDSIPDS